MSNTYDAKSIETLSFKDAIRSKIEMYMGSADNQGVLQCAREIISNSIDEATMGYGQSIAIDLYEGNRLKVSDYGRGCPFGERKDGTEALEAIFMTPHSGGKFNEKTYRSVIGVNGIGGKGVALSSTYFRVDSFRDGLQATLEIEEGNKKDFRIKKVARTKQGTTVEFTPSPKVFHLEEIDLKFSDLKQMCEDWSYLNKNLKFTLTNHVTAEKVTYLSKNGLLDLIKKNAQDPIHPMPIYLVWEENDETLEIAFQWTRGRERPFIFTNGLYNSEGGTPLTGMRTALTRFIQKEAGEKIEGETARVGLVYAASSKVKSPSFSNQTKTKVNNPQLNGMAQKATRKALEEFQLTAPNEWAQILQFLEKERKAEAAAERARRQILEATKDIERNQKKKVFSSDKLKDAEFLGPNSTLLIVEGNGAAASMAVARDPKRYGILGIRGKLINVLSNPPEKVFENEEVKLLLSALNIIPGRYSASKLRYGRLAICVDGDSDGGHIALLIMAALYHLAPQFIKEGRLSWLRAPLYIVKQKEGNLYFYSDEEFNASRPTLKGEISRAKGLGALSESQARDSMFGTNQRMDLLPYSEEGVFLLSQLMGKDIEPRREFVFSQIDFSEIRE